MSTTKRYRNSSRPPEIEAEIWWKQTPKQRKEYLDARPSMGYGEAVRWSRGKESFGKGKLEGVISSETANNAATGAAMIPLLALGLPGGALTAMMVAVFQMHDLEPGPLVFYNSPDLIWIVFAAMFYANLSILFIGLVETKTILYLLKIPLQFLAPMILLLATIC